MPRSSATVRQANTVNIVDFLSFQPLRYLKIFSNFLMLGDKGIWPILMINVFIEAG